MFASCRFRLWQLLVAISVWTSASVAGGEIQVGLAKADITPPIGGLTAGYSSAKPTEAVHDPITARVMVLKSDDACVALVACDLCVYNSATLHDRVKSLGVDTLLLMNTHTHAGPKMNQDDFPSVEQPWRQTVDDRILEAIQRAQSSLFKGYFASSESHIQLGYNRLVQRGNVAVTHFENPQRIPYGSVDRRVGVLRVTDENEKVRAVIVNYACHPVVLGPRNRQLSADYPGVMRQIVEEGLGDDCMCIFVQGGGGDINPLIMARGETREKDFDDVRTMGELLAVEVQRALAFAKEVPGVSGNFRASTRQLQFRHRFKPDEELTLGVTALLINDAIGIITLPGEPFHHFQVDFRSKAGLKDAYLFGYCCDGPYPWPSYLPDLQSAARGGYGASDTTQAEVGAGERLVNQGLVELFTLQGRLLPEAKRHTFDKEPD
ncbi:MAG: neutral/alkaline non-lysosomal ceramidase N-terminal domain-containing protein [Aureliella sp.]